MVFPFHIVYDRDAGELPANIKRSAREDLARTQAHFPEAVPFPHDLYMQMHLLAVLDRRNPSFQSGPAISNVFFRYMHEYYHSVITPSLSADPVHDIILKTIVWTSRLFIKNTLGHKGTHPLYTVWIFRPIEGLQKSQYSKWMEEQCVEILIWILFVGAVNSEFEPNARDWYVAQLRYAIEHAEVKTKYTFEDILRYYPWAAEYDRKVYVVWDYVKTGIGKDIPRFGIDTNSIKIPDANNARSTTFGDDKNNLSASCARPFPLPASKMYHWVVPMPDKKVEGSPEDSSITRTENQTINSMP
jgi:hypothetical protein